MIKIINEDNNKDNEWQRLNKSYKNKETFKSIDSGELRDKLDKFDEDGTQYEIYENKTNDRVTLFW